MVQARAPGAVVQVVLTKVDRVVNPDEKKIEIQSEINKFKKNCESSFGRRGREHLLLRFQDDIITTSIMTPTRKFANNIQKVLGLAFIWPQLMPTTRDDVIEVITNLTTERPPLFPTLGQEIPKSWLTCKNFLYKIRDLGCEDEEELFKVVDEGREGMPFYVHLYSLCL